MTDAVAGWQSVVIETEMDDFSDFNKHEDYKRKPEVREIMNGYVDLVRTGYPEIFKIQ